MAEFCNQCAAELGWPGDFAGLVTEEQVREGIGAVVLCEGCGSILVDHEGNRMDAGRLNGQVARMRSYPRKIK